MDMAPIDHCSSSSVLINTLQSPSSFMYQGGIEGIVPKDINKAKHLPMDSVLQ